MSGGRRTWGAAMASLLVVAMAGAAGCSTGSSGASDPTPSQSRTIIRAQDVVLIGSYDTLGTPCGGVDAANWTRVMQRGFVGSPVTWKVSAARGAGYAVTGPDGVSFSDLVGRSVTPATSTVVLLQGAEDTAELGRAGDAADAVFGRIRAVAPAATIVAFSPLWTGSGPAPVEPGTISDAVRVAAGRYQVQYAPTTTWLSGGRGLTCADPAALTDAGQKVVATKIGDVLRVLFAR